MADRLYVPITGSGSGLAVLMKSNDMRAFMAGVGAQAVRVAQSYSPTPGSIHAEVTLDWNRQCANIVNVANDAMQQEYGGKGRPPLAPLGHVQVALWVTDPNRHRSFLRRLIGR
jgi:hypothetical protein